MRTTAKSFLLKVLKIMSLQNFSKDFFSLKISSGHVEITFENINFYLRLYFRTWGRASLHSRRPMFFLKFSAILFLSHLRRNFFLSRTNDQILIKISFQLDNSKLSENVFTFLTKSWLKMPKMIHYKEHYTENLKVSYYVSYVCVCVGGGGGVRRKKRASAPIADNREGDWLHLHSKITVGRCQRPIYFEEGEQVSLDFFRGCLSSHTFTQVLLQ